MSIGYRAADNRSVPGERLAHIAALPRLAKIHHTGKTPALLSSGYLLAALALLMLSRPRSMVGWPASG
jgi:hypothetical protein